MRCFIALPLPKAARAALDSALQAARQACPDLSWTSPSGWHLTLAFLGELGDSSLACAREALLASVLSPITFRLSRLTAFPPGAERGGPWKTLIAELSEEDGKSPADGGFWGAYRHVNGSLALKASASGLKTLNPEWPNGRPFRPHITLARPGRSSQPKLRELSALISLPRGEWTMDSCILFQSILQRGGAVYTVIEEISFGVGDARAGEGPESGPSSTAPS